jgi:hypothetical protein
VVERRVDPVQQREFDPPRPVEVEHDGRWLPALQRSWHLWDDDRGWVAEVEYTVTYEWGLLTRVAVLPADRLRLGKGRSAPPVGFPHARAS